MVRIRVFMLEMREVRDIVSVGWQWASYTPRCQGKGSSCLVVDSAMLRFEDWVAGE